MAVDTKGAVDAGAPERKRERDGHPRLPRIRQRSNGQSEPIPEPLPYRVRFGYVEPPVSGSNCHL